MCTVEKQNHPEAAEDSYGQMFICLTIILINPHERLVLPDAVNEVRIVIVIRPVYYNSNCDVEATFSFKFTWN